jgi:hypothetical protein
MTLNVLDVWRMTPTELVEAYEALETENNKLKYEVDRLGRESIKYANAEARCFKELLEGHNAHCRTVSKLLEVMKERDATIEKIEILRKQVLRLSKLLDPEFQSGGKYEGENLE